MSDVFIMLSIIVLYFFLKSRLDNIEKKIDDIEYLIRINRNA